MAKQLFSEDLGNYVMSIPIPRSACRDRMVSYRSGEAKLHIKDVYEEVLRRMQRMVGIYSGSGG